MKQEALKVGWFKRVARYMYPMLCGLGAAAGFLLLVSHADAPYKATILTLAAIMSMGLSITYPWWSK